MENSKSLDVYLRSLLQYRHLDSLLATLDKGKDLDKMEGASISSKFPSSNY